MKIVVLGASGMLGSMVMEYLSTDNSLQVKATVRREALKQILMAQRPGVEVALLDAEECEGQEIRDIINGNAWVVNAIGVIKPYIRDDHPREVERAVKVNSLFPHFVARAAEHSGCRLLQIATDCVFSGSKGLYAETDPQDPLDVYGKTKSLGEVYSNQAHHLRCSIIGPEAKGNVSLMEWFLRQPQGGKVNGYTNHQWNGVTTLHFARLCHGIITHGLDLPHVHHIVPSGRVSKAELLHCLGQGFRREDITIVPSEAATAIDRTLVTTNDSLNHQLWAAAGYPAPPSIQHMIEELAQYNFSRKPLHY
jgi:dTDP-4-dehydrorhamnose reductase